MHDHAITLGYVLLFAYITVIAGLAWESQQDFNEESLRARNANCLQFERDHLADVNQLRQTYAYLGQLRPNELDDAINRFVLAQLPETEKKARIDSAPRYCDRPGLGRPEPDPRVPLRPRFLRR